MSSEEKAKARECRKACSPARLKKGFPSENIVGSAKKINDRHETWPCFGSGLPKGAIVLLALDFFQSVDEQCFLL